MTKATLIDPQTHTHMPRAVVGEAMVKSRAVRSHQLGAAAM